MWLLPVLDVAAKKRTGANLLCIGVSAGTGPTIGHRCPGLLLHGCGSFGSQHHAQMLFSGTVHEGHGGGSQMCAILTIVIFRANQTQLLSSSFEPKSTSQIHIPTQHNSLT